MKTIITVYQSRQPRRTLTGKTSELGGNVVINNCFYSTIRLHVRVHAIFKKHDFVKLDSSVLTLQPLPLVYMKLVQRMSLPEVSTSPWLLS